MRWNFTEEAISFIEANNAIFKGHKKLTREEREKLYLIYNEVFNTSRKPSGCGACQRNVITDLYKAYLKYKK